MLRCTHQFPIWSRQLPGSHPHPDAWAGDVFRLQLAQGHRATHPLENAPWPPLHGHCPHSCKGGDCLGQSSLHTWANAVPVDLLPVALGLKLPWRLCWGLWVAAPQVKSWSLLPLEATPDLLQHHECRANNHRSEVYLGTTPSPGLNHRGKATQCGALRKYLSHCCTMGVEPIAEEVTFS